MYFCPFGWFNREKECFKIGWSCTEISGRKKGSFPFCGFQKYTLKENNRIKTKNLRSGYISSTCRQTL